MAIYKQPTPVPVPQGNGYPNNIPSTQTKPTRGFGAATKGRNMSKNSQ